MRRVLCRVLLPLALSAGCLSAGAEDLQIINASFEDVEVPAGTFPIFLPFGWSHHDPHHLLDGGLDAIGVLNPSGTAFFPDGVPDGANVALIFLSGDVGDGVVGLEQTLPHTLQPETHYRLSVMVGNIASGSGNPPITEFFDLDGFPGYAVQLLAGATIVAEDMNSLADNLSDGRFAESVVTLLVGATHPDLDQPLTIRLLNLNQPGTTGLPGIEVDFDAVRLTATPAIPEPRTYALIAAGFVVLLAGARRRRSSSARLRGRGPAR